jgi:hypothetical protein
MTGREITLAQASAFADPSQNMGLETNIHRYDRDWGAVTVGIAGEPVKRRIILRDPPPDPTLSKAPEERADSRFCILPSWSRP